MRLTALLEECQTTPSLVQTLCAQPFHLLVRCLVNLGISRSLHSTQTLCVCSRFLKKGFDHMVTHVLYAFTSSPWSRSFSLFSLCSPSLLCQSLYLEVLLYSASRRGTARAIRGTLFFITTRPPFFVSTYTAAHRLRSVKHETTATNRKLVVRLPLWSRFFSRTETENRYTLRLDVCRVDNMWVKPVCMQPALQILNEREA